jgi:D-alanine-D-alanine ligase
MPDCASSACRKWRVTVLRGGPSTERQVSMAGGKAVADAARGLGHVVTEADITPDDLSALEVPADVVFPVLHGRFGEDGQLQAILEQRGLAFVGSGSAASRVSMDKDASKRVWQAAGLPTAPWAIVTRGDWAPSAGLEPPVVVKPLAEGSSIGVSVCETREALRDVLPKAVADFGSVMVERRLEGPELTVGILGDRPLPVIQVRPANDFYDFEAKYQRNDTAYLLDPDIDQATYEQVQQMAVRAFHSLGCRDLSRIDFIVDRHIGPQLLEINTLPGFTDHSLLPKAAAHIGIPFGRLVDMLLEMAWQRRRAQAMP